ncbi:MAG: hypothetical protein FWE45_03740 [Firmicutes bacterium]|nr:hypothetical protein [Bacillota bacterium]
MEISVSLDPASGKDFKEYVQFLNGVDNIAIHCDVMDGCFVPRKSIPMSEYEYLCKKTKHPIDVHLMIENPVRDIGNFLAGNCRGNIRSICFHAEATFPFEAIKLVEKIRMSGIRGGIAIDLPTKIESIDSNLLFMCDDITVMSVKAGASGQSFNKDALKKVKTLKKLYPDKRIILDGGINIDNIKEVKKSGVDTAAMASAVYSAQDRELMIKQLRI